MKRKSRRTLLPLIMLAGTTTSLSAANLDALERLLIPAFMAQQFANVCIQNEANFAPNTVSPEGDINAFALHIRGEIIANLRNEDAKRVVLISAETARSIARKELELLRAGSSQAESKRLTDWCERSVKPFVTEIISAHYAKHQELDKRTLDAVGN